MNLKYYLRGLGIGIMVTAVIMSVSADDGKQQLSDAEIKARAAQLGMVEESTGRLSDLEKETAEEEKTEMSKATEKPEATETLEVTEGPKATETPEITEEPKATETPKATEEPKATEAPKATEKPEATGKPKATEAPKATEKPNGAEDVKTTEANVQTITIAVNPGESSYTVCKRLQDKGLIASAGDFDSYLCDRGLDKKLRAGSYEVPADAEPEEIAKILTFR